MGHLAEQDGQPGGQAVEHHVERGQGQDVAGKHGAEHGEGVEEQIQQGGDHQPGEQAGEHHRAAGGLRRQGQEEHGQVGQDEEAQPRQVAGEEEALPPQGEGVEQAHGAGAVQVGEHRHGRQQAEHHRQEGGGAEPAGGVQVVEGEHTGPHLRPAGAAVQQDAQGEAHGPDEPVQPPDGPEPGEVLGKQGLVKVRCPGPHSPHLPAHR